VQGWRVDSQRIDLVAHYSLYNGTGLSVDTLSLYMKHVQGLTLQSYSQKRSDPWYYLDSSEYTVHPWTDQGYRVHLRLRDSVSARKNVPLVIRVIKNHDELTTPLLYNRYDIGAKDMDSLVLRL